ncbi:hypothetical protein AC578_3814 [Pseudocercospora eumusae]|uniref:Uncharacterized protein n=1 Tax=Pseudocercospora eumusae TaxID=321146 RepID=A0A139HFJ2_9PEZI|nr:hypothetical protein AC578_3814 [Pseudocercospora eumusae]
METRRENNAVKGRVSMLQNTSLNLCEAQGQVSRPPMADESANETTRREQTKAQCAKHDHPSAER